MADLPVTVRGSVGQISVTGPSGLPVTVRRVSGGTVVAEGAIDRFGDRLALDDLGVTDLLRGQGGLVFRAVDPGDYEVSIGESSSRVRVRALDELPDDYDARVRGQHLGEGYGYLELRDGMRLSCNIAFPDVDRWGAGPYPALVQYSGYDDSRPGFATGDPADDTWMNTEVNVARLLGYAIVGVAIRGTGGSDGSFRLFEEVQGADGYDVIEAVGAQPWVGRRSDGAPKVGMVGRSMPGFAQLLVARSKPPSLAAIAPAAIGGRPYAGAGHPGGIPNVALPWGIAGWEIDPIPEIGGRHQAKPPRYAPGGWDEWVPDHIAAGDETCGRHQLLRGQNVDMVAEWLTLDHRRPELTDHLDVTDWVRTIDAPTIVVGSWQDQESGPWFSDTLRWFPETTTLRFCGMNGTHEETRYPSALTAWLEFHAFYVREEVPEWNDQAQHYVDAVHRDRYPDGLPVPLGRFAGRSFPDALAAYEAEPPVTVLLENGADPEHPEGYPYPSTSVRFDEWPPAEARAERWFVSGGGRLAPDPAEGWPASSAFHYDPSARPPTSAAPGFEANDREPHYDWQPPAVGRSLAVATEPLDEDRLLAGPAVLDLWLRATVADLDLEVTISEVRPDGWETFIQSGWLRVSQRHLDPDRSTELEPWPTHLEADAAALVPGTFVPVRVGVPAFAHIVRRGSRIRVTVEAAGGNQPHWTLAARHPAGVDERGRPVIVEVAHDPAHPSSVALSLIDDWPPTGVDVPPLPAPGALRRQPARRWLEETATETVRRSALARVGLAAVVGLLAAGVGLALGRLLRHRS